MMQQSAPHNSLVISNFHLRKRPKFAKSNWSVSAIKFMCHTLIPTINFGRDQMLLIPTWRPFMLTWVWIPCRGLRASRLWVRRRPFLWPWRRWFRGAATSPHRTSPAGEARWPRTSLCSPKEWWKRMGGGGEKEGQRGEMVRIQTDGGFLVTAENGDFSLRGGLVIKLSLAPLFLTFKP